MEHPDVIREIDALIDSYNWEGVTDEPEKIATSIKQSLRINKSKVYAWRTTQHAQFVIFQLLTRILQHPGIKHKRWILEALRQVCHISFEEYSESIGIRRYRALQNAIPLLRRYMRHHNLYCRHASAMALSGLVYQPNQVVMWLLDHLQSEHSFQVIFEIFDRFGRLFSNRRGQLIRPEIYDRVIGYLESLLKSKVLVMRVRAATLFIRIAQRSTPSYVTDILVEDWTHLDGRRKSHQQALADFIEWMNLLGATKRLEISIALLKNSKEFIVALELWERIAEDYFLYFRGERRIAFSNQEKALLEALLLCKPLWRTRSTPVQEWNYRTAYRFQLEYQGLEGNRATLREQLQHARGSSEEEFEEYWQRRVNLPLQLDPSILREMDS
jgi:hypothetical protein